MNGFCRRGRQWNIGFIRMLLGNTANKKKKKGIGFVRKRGQRGIRQIQGIIRGARCIGSMGMQGGAWRWRRKVWPNVFLQKKRNKKKNLI